MLATPTTPIAQAQGGFVEIHGTVLPGEKGTMQAPFSRRTCVWMRVTVFERKTSGKTTTWKELIDEYEGGPFFVDDGSGELARIDPRAAHFELDQQRVATSGTFNDATPEVERFLADRGHASTGWTGLNKAMRFEEQVICPGDPLHALGPSTRVELPPNPQADRPGPSTQLLLVVDPSQDSELLLSNKSERELVSRLGGSWAVVWGSLGLSALLAMIAGALK